MIMKGSSGWCWSFNVYNTITKESKAHNSTKSFESYESALVDLAMYIQRLMDKRME